MEAGENFDNVKQLIREIDLLVDTYPRLIHTWRFAVGALWYLGRYYEAYAQCPPQSVQEEQYIPDAKKNIGAVLEDKPFTLDWQRGSWFNSAIMRIDALWERLFRLFLPPKDSVNGPNLYLRVEELRAVRSNIPYNASSFGKVRQIVNQLKHEIGGAEPEIRESPELPL